RNAAKRRWHFAAVKRMQFDARPPPAAVSPCKTGRAPCPRAWGSEVVHRTGDRIMDRRTLLVGAAASAAAAASGALILTQGFNPPPLPQSGVETLSPHGAGPSGSAWIYRVIDAPATAELAYQMYDDGGCMYASFGSIMTQLA